MSQHKYEELAAKLRMDIENGLYYNGQRLPSENALAAETGYSRQTIRQAFGVLESEGLADRIQGSGTYVRHRVTRRTQTHNIGVITTYIGEYIFPAILKGIDHVLAKNGYTAMLAATRNRVDNERKALTELLNKPIDGLIVEGTKTALPNPNIDLYATFASRGIPVVFINGFYPDLDRPIYVVADDRSGGRMACEMLLGKGHRHIAGFFKSDDIQGHRRYSGYAEALRNAGCAIEDDHVLWYATENRNSLLSDGAARTLAGCTAAVCYNDEVALQVIKCLERADRVNEVEIVSFDNSTYAQLSSPSFFSLSNPKEILGKIAAEKLLNILAGKVEAPAVLPWNLTE